MRESGLGAFLEACHEGPGDFTDWAARIAPTIDRVTQASGVAIGMVDTTTEQHRIVCATGQSEHVVQAAAAVLGATPGAYRVGYERPFRVDRAARRFDKLAPLSSLSQNLTELFGIAMSSTDRTHITLIMPIFRGDREPSNQRLHRLQRHLAGAVAVRAVTWRPDGDLLIDPERGLLHAASGSHLPIGREILERITRMDFQRAEEDENAQAIWDELWRGGYAVSSLMTDDGRRYVILRKRPDAPGTRLTPAERAVCTLAGTDISMKVIADALGITESTASTHLGRGLAKLGLSHRGELCLLAQGASDRPSPYDPSRDRTC